MAVKVILKQDVPNLGQAGEVKQVAPGYFRNFLLPRGLAVEASKGQIRSLEANSSNRTAQTSRARRQAGSLAENLEQITITIPVRLGEQGRIFGSVTNKDIAEALEHQASTTVDRHKIELREPLKSIGVHTVPVKLDQGVEAQVRVELIPEEA
jgi:large subunit ribosomal protein L9